MKLAVVGSGVSGLVAAWLLAEEHTVEVFEADDRPGGHVHTHDVDGADGAVRVDTGFIVFNELNYPGLCKLFDRLGVKSRESTMSFGVRSDRNGLEYSGSSLGGLFAQKANLFRPSHLRMIRDIFRFHGEAVATAENGSEEQTLGEWLEEQRYSRVFIDNFLLPMGAAIWSCSPAHVLGFPLRFFVAFFDNHRMLQVKGRPVWRTVLGGSRTYVDALLASFQGTIHLSTPIHGVTRTDDGVELKLANGEERAFDGVILATHSDQSLRMLTDADDVERETLGAIPYQENRTVLHTDTSVLPRREAARAAWNYLIPKSESERVAVTYDMNELQGIEDSQRFLVTLNHVDGLDSSRAIREMTYHHPLYGRGAPAAQARVEEINGRRNTWFCGAWCGWGFHEDGLQSALRVTRRFGVDL